MVFAMAKPLLPDHVLLGRALLVQHLVLGLAGSLGHEIVFAKDFFSRL